MTNDTRQQLQRICDIISRNPTFLQALELALAISDSGIAGAAREEALNDGTSPH